MPLSKQPPPGPDELREQPSEASQGISTGQFWAMIGVGIFIILALVGLSAPLVLRSAKASERTEATNNARQVGLALLEFDQEFGSFPNDKTAVEVRKATGFSLKMTGTSSNNYFRQLIAYGIQSEDIFYTFHPDTHKPDKRITPYNHALEPGEVGFSYFYGLNTSGDPGLPILATPMRWGTETFYEEPYGGKAVVLRVDNSVEQPHIRPTDGKVPVGGGSTLLDTGPDTVWGNTHTPDLRHPQK